MSEFDIVIFDCDGVLVDSEMLSAEVLLDELRDVGIVVGMDLFAREFLGRSFPNVAEAIRRASGGRLPEDFEQRYRSRLLATFEARLSPTRGIARVLEALDRPACVATSSTPLRAGRSLSICGLDRHFGAHVFTASQVENGKPAPDLFLFAAERMGADPMRCLVIEDSLPGILAAQAAGMPVWRYVGGAHFTLPGMRESTPAGVPVLEAWQDFYARAPHLARGAAGPLEAAR